MFEKRWTAVSPQLFTSNGTPGGVITVMDSSLFKVKQQVNITANTLPNLNLEVKSVPNDVTIVVGPVGSNIFTYSDISAYTTTLSSAISAIEQKRSSVPVEEINRAVYEEEPTVALRNVLVDKYGNKIDSNNPLPTTATISGDITIGTDGFNPVDPDSMLATGSEDGTKTGIKHAVRVDSELDLRVGISDGANKAVVDALGQLSVKDIDSQTILTSINNILSSGIVKVDDDASQAILNSILTQLSAGGIIIGTEDGTPTGTQKVFVNNRYLQILAAKDRDQDITYADFGTKDQRITRIDYVAPSIGTGIGFTARKNFTYVLDSGKYKRTKITRLLV